MSFDACAAIVQKGDPERFRAVMAANVPARRILFPLYAFNVEVTRAPWVTKEPMIAEMRLQWWADALDEIARRGAVRKHEVDGRLGRDVLMRRGALLCKGWWLRAAGISTRMLLKIRRILTSISMRRRGHLCGQRRGCWGPKRTCVRDFAYGVGVANFLRAIPALEAAGASR